jgi:hypothetical protein
VELLDEALRHNAEGRWFDSRCYHRLNPFGRTVALGLTQPLIQMSTRGKGGRGLGLVNLPPSCATCLETWKPQTAGTLRASTGIALPFLNFNY